jgi:VanZ family protein
MTKALIIFFMITNIVSAQILPQDKQLHIGATYMLSASTMALVYNKTGDKKKATVCGLIIPMIAGIAKEIYDINHGHADVNDILANTVGSSLGVITIRITL